jgi:hypothetical protein
VKEFDDPHVKTKFAGYAPAQKERLLALREMVFETAASTPGVGAVTEVLKWGQPSYQTYETSSGTPLRMDARADGAVALYVNCQSDLIEQFRRHYPDLDYVGFREVVLPAGEPLAADDLRHIMALTLTYHARKKAKVARGSGQAAPTAGTLSRPSGTSSHRGRRL